MSTSVSAVPPGGTLLETFKKSFKDVPIDADRDNAVSTTEFLDAAESLTTIFGSISQNASACPIAWPLTMTNPRQMSLAPWPFLLSRTTCWET